MNILTASRLFTFVREGTMYEISTACFIYCSIFAVQALRKRRVQGHCAAYHFRIGILRLFQHCTGHITTGSWKGRGNQYIEFARVVYCKLPTNGKQLFPLYTTSLTKVI